MEGLEKEQAALGKRLVAHQADIKRLETEIGSKIGAIGGVKMELPFFVHRGFEDNGHPILENGFKPFSFMEHGFRIFESTLSLEKREEVSQMFVDLYKALNKHYKAERRKKESLLETKKKVVELAAAAAEEGGSAGVAAPSSVF